MQEYWVNVYEYKTVKNVQFYSHLLESKDEAIFRAANRKIARPDAKVIYRIHIKMKSVKQIADEWGKQILKSLPEIYK